MPERTAQLGWICPHDGYLTDLAPRVAGKGDGLIGEYGYALALTATGLVRVLWDDRGKIEDISTADIVLFQAGR